MAEMSLLKFTAGWESTGALSLFACEEHRKEGEANRQRLIKIYSCLKAKVYP